MFSALCDIQNRNNTLPIIFKIYNFRAYDFKSLQRKLTNKQVSEMKIIPAVVKRNNID